MRIYGYGGDFLLFVFIGCFAFGVFYSLVSLVLGGHGHGADHGVDHAGGAGLDHGIHLDHSAGLDHGVDLGHGGGIDHSVDLGHSADLSHGTALDHGADAGHGVDTQHHGDSAESPSPFNPLVIASGITAFGAVGLISMKGFGLDSLMSTIVALGCAGVIGAAIFFGIVKFMYGSQSNSVFSLNDLINIEAEVITPVPEKGLGEIAYIANGTRYTMSARSMEGTAIKRGAAVVIREISANAAVIQQKLTLDDIELYNYGRETDDREKPRSDAGNN